MKQINTLPFVTLITGLLFLAGCSGDPQPEARANQDVPISVTVATPSGSSPDAVMASGQVEALQSAAISTRVMGTITHLYVNVGDKVNKGQLLATISSQDLAAKKAQADAMIAGADADLQNARKDLDRFTNLYNKQSASASELDNATLRYKGAQSKLETAKQLRNEVNASIAYTRLEAPFPGTVTRKWADEGSMASPGMPLLVVEQNNLLQVSASIAESDISRIRKGDKAQLDIQSTGTQTAGIITQINPSSSSTGGQYQVKISLPVTAQRDLYAGMYVNVGIPVKSTSASGDTGETGSAASKGSILVPVSALVQNDQLTGLYTISNAHTALLRWVRTGKTVGDKIEVLSGLGPDEPFILHAAGKIYNGAPVRQP